jgi:hypothetical protein
MNCPHCEAVLPEMAETCLACGGLTRPGQSTPDDADEDRPRPARLRRTFHVRPRNLIREVVLRVLMAAVPLGGLLATAYVYRDQLNTHLETLRHVAREISA